MEKNSQKKEVLNYLKEHGSISSLVAIDRFGCTRLSAIIHTLRHKDNYSIATRTVNTKNRYGNTTQYAIYELRGERND